MTIIPIYFFNNSILAVRLISILSGITLIVITFFLIINFGHKKISLAVISAITVAISPWAVFFSRIGTEASLGVAVFGLSFLLFYLSLKRFWFFPLASFILGLSTHAYYSERLISILFLAGFILFFRKVLLLNKKFLILGLILFFFTQIPHLLILNSGAFTRRIGQVNYFNEQFFQTNGGEYRFILFGRFIFITQKFFSQYTSYFSPRNLFSDPDPQPERSIPDLSVFYNWLFIPLLFGIVTIYKFRFTPIIKMIVLTTLVSPVPAALTGDPFYTIRTLVFLWMLTIIISFGLDDILRRISKSFIKYSLVLILLTYSAVALYISYFILMKNEREIFDYAYVKLLDKIQQSPDQKFIVDSSRQLANGIRFAFFKKYNSVKLQKDLKPQVAGQYYSNIEFDEPYILDNIEARPIIWEEDIYKEQILVGDLLAISDNQIKEHYLRLLFDVKDKSGDVVLRAYITDPKEKCNPITSEKMTKIKYCQKYW